MRRRLAVPLLSLLPIVWGACSDAGGGVAHTAPPPSPPPLDASAETATPPADGGSEVADVVTFDAADPYGAAEGLTDAALRQALYDLVKNNVALGYDAARDAMFGTTSTFDVKNGMIECIYTGRQVAPDGTRVPGGFNTEHTWPQSLGASSEPARSDLHHIFPVDDAANSARANFPFAFTDCTTACGFSVGGSKLGPITGGTDTVFEVRPERRGDVARAHFYFSVRYQLSITPTEEPSLRTWSKDDPVDSLEKDRNDAIFALQKNRNPFVDRPDFVDAISDF